MISLEIILVDFCCCFCCCKAFSEFLTPKNTISQYSSKLTYLSKKLSRNEKKKRNSILTFFSKLFFFSFHHFSQQNTQINGRFSCHHRRKTVIILRTHFANHTFDSKCAHFSLSCRHDIKTGGYTYFLTGHEISCLSLRPAWNFMSPNTCIQYVGFIGRPK